jgi:Amt family ammonium transporter
VVVHAVGGWIGLAAVLLLGARRGRYSKEGRISAHPPSSIPFLALGAWILIVGWFGFNVMSAQRLDGISGLVAINSLMAMVGGTLSAMWAGKNDPGFIHNGPLAGLVAVCAGSDLMHPLGALVVGLVAGGMFVWLFTQTQNRWKIDDVLGVWPLHGICGAWGGIAAGISARARWVAWVVSAWCPSRWHGQHCHRFWRWLCGVCAAAQDRGIRLDEEEEFNGADLTIHQISATPDRETNCVTPAGRACTRARPACHNLDQSPDFAGFVRQENTQRISPLC